VKLFAQHGFSDGLKTAEGLRKELIDGVIFSPRDITPENLQEEYSCYFAPRRYDQLFREGEVIEDVSKVLECEAALPLTALIGPNIIIGRSFDSPEATIAMNFVRATGVQGKKIAPEKRIYATLAVSGEALINIEELVRFLNQLIALETPPDGFYVLVAAGNTEAGTDLFKQPAPFPRKAVARSKMQPGVHGLPALGTVVKQLMRRLEGAALEQRPPKRVASFCNESVASAVSSSRWESKK
jgi:hypothetical protein